MEKIKEILEFKVTFILRRLCETGLSFVWQKMTLILANRFQLNPTSGISEPNMVDHVNQFIEKKMSYTCKNKKLHEKL